jgi:hypothetical protein
MLNEIKKLIQELEELDKKFTELAQEVNYHRKKWQVYEQNYILHCFEIAKVEDIDLRKIIRENPGCNCVFVLMEELVKKYGGDWKYYNRKVTERKDEKSE